MEKIISHSECIRRYDCDRCPWPCPDGKKNCEICKNRCACCDADCFSCNLICENRKKVEKNNQVREDRIISKEKCEALHHCKTEANCPFHCMNGTEDCNHCDKRCPCCLGDCMICDLTCDNRTEN